jgi:predicted dehydrogenase
MASSKQAAARRRPAGRQLGVAMVGHAFMGRAHANAFRQVNHFFDLPLEVVPRVVVGRNLGRAEAARPVLGFHEASADLDAVLARSDIDLVEVANMIDYDYEIELESIFDF